MHRKVLLVNQSAMMTRNVTARVTGRRGVVPMNKSAVCFWESEPHTRLKSFSAQPSPSITGTIPVGGKGVAVSQYAEVILSLSLHHRCWKLHELSLSNKHLFTFLSRVGPTCLYCGTSGPVW